MRVQPVILCPASDARLWPLARQRHAKQLLTLAGTQSLLQATAQRLDATAVPQGGHLEPPLVATDEESRFNTAEQLRQAGVAGATIFLEPVSRGSAPAVTIAALAASSAGDDPVLVVMPADHLVEWPEAFRTTVLNAVQLAADGRLVTIGVAASSGPTTRPCLRRGEPIAGYPAAATATWSAAGGADDDGGRLVDCGIYILRASLWLEQIEAQRPDILACCRAALCDGTRERDFLRLGATAFAACPAAALDDVLHPTLSTGGAANPGVVLPLDAGWSDVGAWDALWEIGEKDGSGNVVDGDVVTVATKNALIRAESRLVACVGVADVVVVETADAVLVAQRDQLPRLGDVVQRLHDARRTECEQHRKVYRPWGWYDSIDAGPRFQVKRIVINPGARLSLQTHHHRAEHWTVVAGTARVTCGEQVFLLSENQSTYIPLGTMHRLENPGKVPLEIIEVQSGAYLGEDDIVRYADSYGRETRAAEPTVKAES
jgi:mannose-1-phosphate guanylyltransferase / mannose-6-phosphate isomerase